MTDHDVPELNEPEAKRLKLDNDKAKVPATGITESDAGITQYVDATLKGFKGILKQRYTDFLVNEINLEGEVVRLTDLGIADKKDRRRERRQKERDESDENDKKENQDDQDGAKQEVQKQDSSKSGIPELQPGCRQRLVEKIGEDSLNQVIELFSTGTKLEVDKTFDSKEERTAIHQLFREAFNSKLETKTTPENKFIITLATKNSRRYNLSKLDKQSLGPSKEFLHFTVYKENKETMEVANLLSKFLRIPPKSVSYAGTKDRRGVTVQRACISKIKLERINGMNKTLRGIKLGSFVYESSPLRLGDLQGNEFFITIRDVEAHSQEVVNQSLSSLRDNGFINYYGMQRFGTFSISTHEIGKYILTSQWEKVVALILSMQELVIPESIEARKIWHESKDARKALSLMPKKCVAEYAILKSLAQDPKGYLNAVMQIPRNLRVMYAHAYQSFVWNTVVSERIKRFGLKVVEGDLVIEDKQAKSSNEELDEEFQEDLKEVEFTRARYATKEEIDNQSKSIFDIVLATPGFDVLYPKNEFSDIYKNLMEKDGIDYMNMRRTIREFSLAGSYRSVVVKPGNVEWWIRKYDDSTDQLVRTDFDILQQDEDEKLVERVVAEDAIDGSKTAVVLKLQLGSSQYATMALREVMKLDTSRRGDGLDVRQ